MDSRFREYLADAVGCDRADKVMEALSCPASVSVRLNPSKFGEQCAESHFGISVSPVRWSRYGFLLGERPDFTLDPWLHAGAYYVQDSSAMFVGEIFRQCLESVPAEGRPVRVLDLCAAPGGKTTDLAASLRCSLGDSFLLVANEVIRGRASVLTDNVALWGDPNVMVTNADPADFASLKGYFDIILADVPCSGEGMFRKDSNAVAQWSADNVALCQARQRRILADIWPALAPGGTLVYSTCTFNRFENDCNIEWLLEQMDASPVVYSPELSDMTDEIVRTDYGFLLLPGFVPGEGQYCAAVCSGTDGYQWRKPGCSGAGVKRCKTDSGKYFTKRVVSVERSGVIIALPESVASDIQYVSGLVRTLQSGCAAGISKGGTLVPSADLALCISQDRTAFPRVDTDLKTALSFLHRDTVAFPDSPTGFLELYYEGLPIGFVKNLGQRCNSLHPQSRRIRMDIYK